MDKLAWLRSLNHSLCLPCRKIKRFKSPTSGLICLLCFTRVSVAFCSQRREQVKEPEFSGFCHQIKFALQICLFAQPSCFTPCLPSVHRRAVTPLGLGSPWICAKSLGKRWDFPNMPCLGAAMPVQRDTHEMCIEMCAKPRGGRTHRVTTLLCPALRGKDTAGESASQGQLGRAGAVLVGVASRDAASWRLV